jgi:hypothetical protein
MKPSENRPGKDFFKISAARRHHGTKLTRNYTGKAKALFEPKGTRKHVRAWFRAFVVTMPEKTRLSDI